MSTATSPERERMSAAAPGSGTAPAGGRAEGTPESNPAGGGGADVARTAGRGGIAVLGAKLFFLVVGFAQQPLLRLAVGLTDFGALAQALVVANTVNNVVIQSGTQGVSRTVAAAPGHEQQALRAALRVHVPLALVIAAAMLLGTPFYARFEHAEDVVPPLAVLAGVALLYGIYAPLIGYLNGRNRFSRQAGLDVTFAALRTLGLVGLGYAFVAHGASGVLGTTVGWLAAAVMIVPLALRATGTGAPLPPASRWPAAIPSARKYLAMLAPIAGAQLCTNLLMQTDIALLGRFLSDHAATHPSLAVHAGAAGVKEWVAIYKECQTFAFLPYQLLFSVTLVLFPMLARARAGGDESAIREYVARGGRLAAVFCGLIVGVIVAMPESLLAFAYGAADAARGADVLRIMALAQGAFAMLSIATTVLTSLGRERTAAVVTLVAVGAVAVACLVLVPSAASEHDQLVRSAEASGAALVLTMLVAGALVRLSTGAFVPARTIVRTGVALGACLAIGMTLPRIGRLAVPFAAAGIAVVYLGILAATRELGRADLAMLAAMRRRRA